METKEQPSGWTRVLTVDVMHLKTGLFMATSPDIKGLIVHGRSIGQALGHVETAVSDLAEAGCKQSQAVLARALEELP